MKAELKCTQNYGLFKLHPCNRPLHGDPELLRSMQKYGFMPSSPLQVKRNGDGTFLVVRGHHRLYYAKLLKLPVYYIVDETNTDPGFTEGCSRQTWSIPDFAEARAQDGDSACKFLLDFQHKHELTMGSATSLVGGETAGSKNKARHVKAGTFKVGDMKHANAVVRITDACRKLGLPFGTASAFVAAVSMSLRIPEFDGGVFLHRIGMNPKHMAKRGRVDEYLDEIEGLYNHMAKGKRFPLKFRAMEVSRERRVAALPKARETKAAKAAAK